ncbi:YolD-like family protein [Priestia megaterium]|uniref:YolD-like family protein n=1 Tax=Priestia megaterium TaxID=1404 RepID=UPI001F5E363C|nr:YolD-like family protein [Priestia megaterium]
MKNGLVTVHYYENESLQTCKGRVYNLNLHEQTLSLRDEKQNIFLIRLSGVEDIY